MWHCKILWHFKIRKNLWIFFKCQIRKIQILNLCTASLISLLVKPFHLHQLRRPQIDGMVWNVLTVYIMHTHRDGQANWSRVAYDKCTQLHNTQKRGYLILNITLYSKHERERVSEKSFTSHLTHNTSFWRRVFPGNYLHWYWQLKTNRRKCIKIQKNTK